MALELESPRYLYLINEVLNVDDQYNSCGDKR